MANSRVCSIPDCGKPHVARGYCDFHYRKHRMVTAGACSVEGCAAPQHAGGMCSAHYSRWKAHGGPLAGATSKSAGIEFIEAVALTFKGDECLRWPISLTGGGYGQFCINNKMFTASRYVCEATYGPAPSPRHHAAHNCGNAWCVNPRHLRWATPVENNADKLSHGTHNKGERHGNAKLTNDQVRAIRAMDGTEPHSAIASRFGVSQTMVSRIIRRDGWGHI